MPEDFIDDPELLLELFEERAAIMEYEGGMPREQAEMLAAKCYGFESKHRLYNWVEDLLEDKQ